MTKRGAVRNYAWIALKSLRDSGDDGLEKNFMFFAAIFTVERFGNQMASPRGFEPPAPGLGNLCSIQLSYGDKGVKMRAMKKSVQVNVNFAGRGLGAVLIGQIQTFRRQAHLRQ